MKTVALISGGKDSCFNMMCCVAEGHNVVALANLRPVPGIDEMDSYMYQTVGHTAIDVYAEAMGLPLYSRVIKGKSLDVGIDYSPNEEDEVEDLFLLLQTIKREIGVEAVSVGAILSDYQRIRVENVCCRLGLTSLSFLWRRDQETLLKEMIDCGVKARIIKVAAMGLDPDVHLGMTLEEIYPHMLKMKEKYGLNVCGEGGEYETFVLDCPLFRRKIRITQVETVIHSDDAFAPVGYMNIKQFHLENKTDLNPAISKRDQMQSLPITTTKTWLQQCADELDEQDSRNVAEAEGVIVSVPDWIVCDDEVPSFQTDGLSFQVSGIKGYIDEGTGITEATDKALRQLKECLNASNLKTADIASMSLYVGDMANFATINNVYKLFFKTLPPVRLCIQANLPRNVALQLDCQGRLQREEGDRKCMHVQGLSHWAPANIGPYSQAVVTGDKLFMAGIVPLVPATLAAVSGGITTQCSIALAHVVRVMSAIENKCTLSCCPMVVCYLTLPDFIENARTEWKKALQTSQGEDGKPKLSSVVQYCTVPALPKGVAVEWHVYAWPHLTEDNDIQDYEMVEKHEYYSLLARAVYCAEQKHLFSCHISVDVKNSEVCAFLDPWKLANQMLELYCRVLERRDSHELPPLVKVLFSPLTFRYPVLEKCFSDAIASLNNARVVGPPVISLVPVTGLETTNQILAWCQ